VGTWGTGILQDDFACDVHDGFMERLDAGESFKEIRAALEQEYADALEDPDEGPVFWLAFAKAQWESGALQPDVLAKVEGIVESGSDLERWEEAFDESDYGRRKAVLKRFLKTIQTPRSARHIRRPRQRRSRYALSVYKPGDCLAVRLSDGDWGAALVLAAKDDPDGAGYGMNLVGLLRYKCPDKPDESTFRKREWLTRINPDGNSEPNIRWSFTNEYKVSAPLLEVVGNVDVIGIDPNDSPLLAGWDLDQEIERQFARESNNR
jgi:hypothetical protein